MGELFTEEEWKRRQRARSPPRRSSSGAGAGVLPSAAATPRSCFTPETPAHVTPTADDLINNPELLRELLAQLQAATQATQPGEPGAPFDPEAGPDDGRGGGAGQCQ